MPEEKRATKRIHNIILENRSSLSLSGVTDVGSFDEQMIIVNTDVGELAIVGENLHISKLSIDTGDLAVEGMIARLSYTDVQNKNGGFLSKLLR